MPYAITESEAKEPLPDVVEILCGIELILESRHPEILEDFKQLIQMIVRLADAAHNYKMCSVAGGQDGDLKEQHLSELIEAFQPTGAHERWSRISNACITLDRVRDALVGEFDATRLNADEREYFNSMLGGAMDGRHTASARRYWAVLNASTNEIENAADDAEHQHLLSKTRDAVTGGRSAWSMQSTGERLAVALALNHFDWLQSMDYTIAEAIERIGPRWAGMIPDIAKILCNETSFLENRS